MAAAQGNTLEPQTPRSAGRFGGSFFGKTDQAQPSEKGSNGKEKSVSRWPRFGFFSGASSSPPRMQQTPGLSFVKYVFLFLVAFLDLFAKKSLSYEPLTAILFSLLLAFIYWLAVHSDKISSSIVGAALLIDIIGVQSLLHFLPAIEFTEILIAIKVFIWFITAGILLLISIFEAADKGEKLPLWANLFLFAMIALLVFGIFPQFAGTYDAYAQGHEQYYAIADEKAKQAGALVEEAALNVVDYWGCLFAIEADATINTCLEDKRAEKACKPFKENKDQHETCIKQQKGIATVQGATDKTITHFLKASIQQSEDFQPALLSGAYPVPALFIIEHNKEKPIPVEAGCFFRQQPQLIGAKNIDGKIIGEQSFSVAPGDYGFNLLCAAEEPLKAGTYQAVFEVTMRDVETTSSLKRLFIGDKTKEEADKLRQQYFPGKTNLALAPEEFVRVNFLLGQPPANPLIDADARPLLISSLENAGTGEIVAVKSADITLDPALSVDENEPGCSLHSENLAFAVPGGAKKIPLSICNVDVGEALQNPSEYAIAKEFEATVVYDYKLQRSFDIKVVGESAQLD